MNLNSNYLIWQQQAASARNHKETLFQIHCFLESFSNSAAAACDTISYLWTFADFSQLTGEIISNIKLQQRFVRQNNGDF